MIEITKRDFVQLVILLVLTGFLIGFFSGVCRMEWYIKNNMEEICNER